ncbi:MAG: hypothetical protein QF892_01410 [Dehalococcoidales bacterium]|nr:hypothetical protein [Dehalococcoidales bacterium]
MHDDANSIETLKAERDGLSIREEVDQLSAQHDGWESIDDWDRERLKWMGIFFRKLTPGLFMMRVRITGGQVAAVQLRSLAEIARRVGNGVLDITTRQQVQIRSIGIKDVPGILKTLKGVDLTSLQTGGDNVRNVTGCALAGLTPLELFDASSIGRQFAEKISGNPTLANLPRKMNVGITGCLENCTHSESQDIAMTPALRKSDGEPGFNVAVGGKMGSGGMTVARPLDIFVEPRDAPLLAVEIVRLFSDEGFRKQRNQARLAFLLEEWGVERFRAVLETRWGRSFDSEGTDTRLSRHNDHLGVHPQMKLGLYSVGLCVPTGRMVSEQADELARLAEVYGSGEIRLTTGQNAILFNVMEDRLDDLIAEPLLEQFSPNPHPNVAGLVTCTGSDYCSLGLIDTKRVGRWVTEELIKQYPEAPPITMHWSGCPAGCGNHQAADIGFQGIRTRVDDKVVDGVQIFVGGRTGNQGRPGVRIMDLIPVDTLKDILPVVIKHLELLKQVQRESKKEKLVLMVPAMTQDSL